MAYVCAGAQPSAVNGRYNGAHVELLRAADGTHQLFLDGTFKAGDLHNGITIHFDYSGEEWRWETESGESVPADSPGAEKVYLHGVNGASIKVAGQDRVDIDWPMDSLPTAPSDSDVPADSMPVEWIFFSWATEESGHQRVRQYDSGPREKGSSTMWRVQTCDA